MTPDRTSNETRRLLVPDLGEAGLEPIGERRILHCDMDCFFAAVHMRDDPKLQGRPVVIGGSPEGRGVVAAASYEAREFGVRSAMPASKARRLCPHAVFLRSDFSRYREESDQIFQIFRRFTEIVQPVSVDEAYLDVGEASERHGSATAIAQEIRRQVQEERRLTVSVGVGPNRLIAKIASDFHKPDGLTVVPPHKVEAFLESMPVRALPGVGPATAARLLERLGVETVLQLRSVEEQTLRDHVGRFRFGPASIFVGTRRTAGSYGKREKEPQLGAHLLGGSRLFRRDVCRDQSSGRKCGRGT